MSGEQGYTLFELPVKGEQGFSLVELLVTLMIGMIAILGVMALTDISIRGSTRVAGRVEADQRGRTALERLMAQLHSTCVGNGSQPILAGSDSDTIRFLHYFGEEAAPVPDLRVVELNGSTLEEDVYPGSGTAPDWSFSSTPSGSQELLTRVEPASLGDPPADAPVFQYFTYDNGRIATDPLPVPLSNTDAASTVAVTVSFAAAPAIRVTDDPEAPVSLTDTAVLRTSSADEVTPTNPPCT